MAATESTMLDLGTHAPEFRLEDVVSGSTVTAEDFDKQPLLLMFICTHCPFVKHVEGELAALGNAYAKRGVGVVAIGSNDAEAYPADGPAGLKEQAERVGFEFPYLFDKTQAVAKAYTAACTPDFFLFDANHTLVYRGRLDASRPGNDEPVTGAELRGALEALLAGEPMPSEQRPSMGCNIKWKAGNAPDYYGA
ncbi:thioredoxin family protein [soil metagenome]